MARKKAGKELSMRKIREVLRLAEKGEMSERDIARSCSVSHTTAGKYLRLAEERGLSYRQIEGLDDEEFKRLLKGKKVAKRSDRPQPDWCWVHEELKKKSVTLYLLWQEYKSIHTDGYQPTQFYELYNKWVKKLAVSLRQTYKAGEKMFVDYAGQTVGIVDRQTGEEREAQIFVAVLGASNYSFSCASWDQCLPNWIAAHIKAFEYFGGLTEIVVCDNLRTGISKSCRYEPDINPTYHDMAVHYGTAIVPARVSSPKDKAKVEAGVLVVERWILARLRNRTFFSLGELNAAIALLLIELNHRPFKKLDGSRASWFEKIEKPALRALPESRYEFARWKKARVNIDYHVELGRHYYSVPYRLVQERVRIRYTARTVEIFYQGKRVASHVRDDRPGLHTTCRDHMPRSHREYLGWTPSRIIRWAHTFGESTAGIVERIIESRDHPAQGYRSCLGILRLGKRYSPERLEAACKRAILIEGWSYKSVRSILQRELDKKPLPERKKPDKPIRHPNIRGSEYYH
jgi:transposase